MKLHSIHTHLLNQLLSTVLSRLPQVVAHRDLAAGSCRKLSTVERPLCSIIDEFTRLRVSQLFQDTG